MNGLPYYRKEFKGDMERLTISGTKEAKPDVTIREVLNKLAEYEDLEEQGKLLELPCAVGDRSFVVWQKKGQNPIRKMELKKIEIHESKRKVYQMEFTGNKGCWFKFHDDDFGKTVFLTREEAESALEELER